MKDLVLRVRDDLDRMKGIDTEADTARTLTYQDKTVELDLTTEHARDLDRLLQPYLNAGAPSGAVAAPADLSATRAYNKNMREWAEANGHAVTYAPGKGPTYYPRKTREAYAAYLAGQQKQEAG